MRHSITWGVLFPVILERFKPDQPLTCIERVAVFFWLLDQTSPELQATVFSRDEVVLSWLCELYWARHETVSLHCAALRWGAARRGAVRWRAARRGAVAWGAVR